MKVIPYLCDGYVSSKRELVYLKITLAAISQRLEYVFKVYDNAEIKDFQLLKTNPRNIYGYIKKIMFNSKGTIIVIGLILHNLKLRIYVYTS